MKLFRYIYCLIAIIAVQSCLIDNDMSYPRIYADILTFEVEGQKSVSIDSKSRTVSVVLSETAEIGHLLVRDITFSEGVTSVDNGISKDTYIDLSSPVTMVLHTYQDYTWTISATQPIERYVTVENQVGKAAIFPETRSVTVYVTQHQDRRKINVTGMKLAPEGSVIVSTKGGPDGQVTEVNNVFPITGLDCFLERTFDVEYNGNTETWTMVTLNKEVESEITSVIPWCYSADITGLFDGVGTPRIEYREASAEEWSVFESLSVSGTDISARLTGLKEGTQYEIRLSTDEAGEAVTFTTGLPEQIENMGFDNWYSKKSGTKDIWYPNLNETVKIWGTANPGSGSFIGSLTQPESTFVAVPGEGKNAARLESKNAVLAFAAGNIYTGEFGKISGLGAILDWGTPFTGRPKALRGYYSYSPKLINKVEPPYEDLMNTMDQFQILVMLTDWDKPFTVNTSKNIFVDQSRDNESIIAYGKLESDEDTSGEYKEFTLELDYWRPDATPTYAVVIACASYKGDFFTGAEGSVMYVDEFEFVYE